MLVNESKDRVWHGEVKIANTFFKRFKGLMLTRDVNYALVFLLPAETRANAAIHMFFMLSDIDVIWLDSARRVVDFKTARKWRMYSPRKPARYIIEGPVGLIQTLDAEEGDLISWTHTKEREKAISVRVSLPDKISFDGSNRMTLTKSMKEAKTEEA